MAEFRSSSCSVALAPIFAVLMSSAAAWADGPRPIDVERHEVCLSENRLTFESCFFRTSSQCEEEEIVRAASQLQARMWCDLRERDLWLQTIDDSVRTLLHDLPNEEAVALRRQHEHWLAGRELACSFPHDYLSGTQVLLASDGARCSLRHAQVRGAELLSYLAALGARGFAFQKDGR